MEQGAPNRVDRDWYGRDPQSYTLQLIAEVSPFGPPSVLASRFGQSAYEAHQLYIYMNQILSYRRQVDGQFPVTRDAAIIAIAARALAKTNAGPVAVKEFGSTLFGLIDRVEAAAFELGVNLPHDRLRYIGVEKSRFFAEVAAALHPDREIVQVQSVDDLEKPPSACIEYSFQATSYGFATVAALADWLGSAKLCYSGIWFSESNRTEAVSLMGKSVTLFGFSELVEEMRRRGFKVGVDRAERIGARDFQFYCVWVLCHRLEDAELEAAQATAMKWRDALGGLLVTSDEPAQSLFDAVRDRASTQIAYPEMRFGREPVSSSVDSHFLDFSRSSVAEGLARHMEGLDRRE